MIFVHWHKSFFLTCGFLFPASTMNIIAGLRSFFNFRVTFFFLFHLLAHSFFLAILEPSIFFVGLHFCGHHYFWCCLLLGMSLNIGSSSFFRAKQCNIWSDWVIWDQTGGNRAKRGQTGSHGATRGQTVSNGIHSHT